MTNSQGAGVCHCPAREPASGGRSTTRIIRESLFYEGAKEGFVLGRLRKESVAEDARYRIGARFSERARLARRESGCGARRLELTSG
jgi:hypothetical protein